MIRPVIHPVLRRFLLLLVSWTVGQIVPQQACAQPIDFARDVRPILARHCFKCHGPDDNARKANLRLDSRERALATARSGRKAIVPGNADNSELIQRITATDPTEIMPPPAAKNPLSGAQKLILRRWIAAGADYQTHWSFLRPRQLPAPPVRNAQWPKNPIDRFVLARLENSGLQPAQPADRYTLIRRVYLDLIGLPPTPAEADAFVADSSPDSYEKVVDRLLESPHYGERWARRWLDLARYADTNGYEKDRPRSIWPYRDWVIAAINADMPFDQFTIEQLAGDMLPNATPAQRIATGFHRNTMINEEGGIDPLEFRFHALTDRVGTTGTVWLGLTLGCVQCHSHKYDPISHREYYQFMAFLNNADEPEYEIPVPELVSRRREIEGEIVARNADLPNRFPAEPASSANDKCSEKERRAAHLEKRLDAWLTRSQPKPYGGFPCVRAPRPVTPRASPCCRTAPFWRAAIKPSAMCTTSRCRQTFAASPRFDWKSCPTIACPRRDLDAFITKDRSAISF